MPIASGACEDLSRSGDGLIVATIGRKPGIPALRVTGKGSGCIRCMIVSVCSAFWLFLREKVLIAAKLGGKATVCASATERRGAVGKFVDRMKIGRTPGWYW